ncbi:hypothetical protein LCGC14_2993460, partial [marine sediment metagenome]
MSETAEFHDRMLSLGLARVSEAAALASARLVGRGDEKAADQAAVNAMRDQLNKLDIAGVVVIGEGEETIVELLAALEAGGDLADIPGIAYRDGDRTVLTAPRAPIADLSTSPVPAHHLLRYDRYRSNGWNRWSAGHRQPFGVVTSGRGCYGRCNFCAAHCVFGRKIRHFPIRRVTDEIDLLVERYGFLGGMASAGEVHPFMANHVDDQPLDTPVYTDWVRRMHALWPREGKDSHIFKEAAMLAAEELCLEAGTELLYH